MDLVTCLNEATMFPETTATARPKNRRARRSPLVGCFRGSNTAPCLDAWESRRNRSFIRRQVNRLELSFQVPKPVSRPASRRPPFEPS